MTLGDFGNLLDALIVGQTCTLPYDVYAVVFPPGEPDQDARTRAFDSLGIAGAQSKIWFVRCRLFLLGR